MAGRKAQGWIGPEADSEGSLKGRADAPAHAAMLVLLSFLSNTAFNFAIGLLLARFLGPDQYGRFALAVSCGVVLQTLCFDWARVATARFYSERVAATAPGVRATVDALMAMAAVGLAIVTVLVLVAGIDLPLSRPLTVLAAMGAVVNGSFDCWTAMLRARFLDHAYARLIFVKNLLSTVLTLGAALWFGSAALAMLGISLSMAGSALSVRSALKPPPGARPPVDRGFAATALRYALPVVAANLLYQTIPLADRILIARQHGFAASGQFSLAFDIGLRVVSAVGSALDVFLFQIAVRADELHGAAQARRQIGHNIGVVLAVLLPACAGLWIVMPSFEALVVPPEFRGPFGTYLRLLLPGLFCYAVAFYALHPLFQIAKRTGPLVAVAGLASAANLVGIALLPAGADAGLYAEVQAAALALALLALVGLALATSPAWPRGRDLVGMALATAAMAAACRLPSFGPAGPTTLALAVGIGVATYAAVAVAVDLCGVRGWLTAALPAWRIGRNTVNPRSGR